jgi:hypothetical protein
MFHPKHVELFAGNKILYKKCHFVGTFYSYKKQRGYCLQAATANLLLRIREGPGYILSPGAK